jgi:hypothetical protein
MSTLLLESLMRQGGSGFEIWVWGLTHPTVFGSCLLSTSPIANLPNLLATKNRLWMTVDHGSI